MDNPIVFDNKPQNVTLKKGMTYYFCTCGKSKDQPFCDGSHSDTDFKPKQLVAEETAEVWACNCKHSKNMPFCDGSHDAFPSKKDV